MLTTTSVSTVPLARTASTLADDPATIEYGYDALGRRISKTVDGDSQYFYYDGKGQVVYEVFSDGSNSRTYIYGNDLDEILVMTMNGTNYYYMHDHLGSVRMIVDDSGHVDDVYEYDAYGNPAMYSDLNYNEAVQSYTGNEYLFAGRRYDAEIGKYYMRNRFYDPDNGRFLQTDPLGTIPAGRFNVLII